MVEEAMVGVWVARSGPGVGKARVGSPGFPRMAALESRRRQPSTSFDVVDVFYGTDYVGKAKAAQVEG